ncbi:unnamed protein product [Bursaphelenchus okinawaensis]|uniref:Uncharacterized protein n=1 Tax=Bursaphelenchus okinawaensis TaxID=465554 RepID=A0A811K2S4_9BILA|nr:unnamed protein product [Bursaphelenchus okinawaensis]CAG9090041.1 unnamed protein product [Bursaphelenchus okinawaensis]
MTISYSRAFMKNQKTLKPKEEELLDQKITTSMEIMKISLRLIEELPKTRVKAMMMKIHPPVKGMWIYRPVQRMKAMRTQVKITTMKMKKIQMMTLRSSLNFEEN